MIRIGIIASGSGTNAEAIMNACESGILKEKAEVTVLISNKPGAVCLDRAKNHKIPAVLISSKDFKGKREEFDKLMVKELEKKKVELVCLAGYMRLISPLFLKKFPNTLNIHPSLLPSFPGMHGYRDAVDYGVKISGCTVIIVDEGIDNGAIILQKTLEVRFDDDENSLKERGLKLEWQAYPKAIELFCDGKLEKIGRKVKIK